MLAGLLLLLPFNSTLPPGWVAPGWAPRSVNRAAGRGRAEVGRAVGRSAGMGRTRMGRATGVESVFLSGTPVSP